MSSAFDLNRKDHGCILTLLAPDCNLGRDQGARSPLKRQQGEAGWNSKGLGLPRGSLGSSSTESPWYTCRGYARAEARARPTPRGTQGLQATAGATAGTCGPPHKHTLGQSLCGPRSGTLRPPRWPTPSAVHWARYSGRACSSWFDLGF